MIKQTCPFNSSGKPKEESRDLGGKPQSLSPTEPATAFRDEKVALIYNLSEQVISIFWKNCAHFIAENPPGLIKNDGTVLSATDFKNFCEKTNSKVSFHRALSICCNNTLNKLMQQTCAELLNVDNSPLRELAMHYKKAPNYLPEMSSVEEYLSAGLNNAVATILPTFLTISTLLDKHPDQYSALHFETVAKKSKAFVMGLASCHLAVLGSIVRGFTIDEEKGFCPSDLLMINGNGQLALTRDFTASLTAGADNLIRNNLALSHTKISCPAIKADGNVVAKLYDWMLNLALERADLYNPTLVAAGTAAKKS